jgi:hypothetical protein
MKKLGVAIGTRTPGVAMTYLPPPAKDVLLLVVTLGMVVMVLFQVRQNNLIRQRQHESCATRIELARQGNRAAVERVKLERAVDIFVAKTRTFRNDPHSTSYDPGFVTVIDRRVQPLLDSIHPFKVPIPPPC